MRRNTLSEPSIKCKFLKTMPWLVTKRPKVLSKIFLIDVSRATLMDDDRLRGEAIERLLFLILDAS